MKIKLDQLLLSVCFIYDYKTHQPESLDEPLHFLCLSLHFNLSLELPESVVQVHAGEVHLIHHAAETHPAQIVSHATCHCTPCSCWWGAAQVCLEAVFIQARNKTVEFHMLQQWDRTCTLPTESTLLIRQ